MSEHGRSDETKSVLEHIGELRRKLFIALSALIVGGSIAHNFHQEIIALILKPAGTQRLLFLSPLEPFFFILKVDLIAGLVLAFPIVFWCIFSYIKPALPIRARVTLFGASLISLILLTAGLLYAYLVTIPVSLKFLSSISIPGVENVITMQHYLGFFFSQALIIMLVFQIPIIIITGLSLGIFTVKGLSKKRRYVYLLGTVALAIITPTTDIFNLGIILAPTIVIFEFSLIAGLIMQFTKRKKKG